MDEQRVLTESVLQKVLEQVERLEHLLSATPADRLMWSPSIEQPGANNKPAELLQLGDLIGHLLECAAGVCAVLYAANPEPLAHFAGLRDLPVNRSCDPQIAIHRLDQYRGAIVE